jgi:hypothetical protein
MGVCCVVMDEALAAPPDDATFLFFGGTDFRSYGAFLYGGLLWSPGGVDNSGFTGIRQQPHLATRGCRWAIFS